MQKKKNLQFNIEYILSGLVYYLIVYYLLFNKKSLFFIKLKCLPIFFFIFIIIKK